MLRKSMCFILLLGMISAAGAADRVAIYDIQYSTDPSGDSPMVNQTVTFSGIVTAIFFDGYYVADAAGPWNAVYVFGKRDGPQVGDEVEVTGRVSEYYNMTEITNVTDFSILSSGNTVTATSVDSQTVNQEKYESVLVTIPDVSVTSLDTYGEFTINDGSAPFSVDDLNDYMYFPQVGDYLTSISGVVTYSFSEFKLEPRFTNDIVSAEIPHYALKGDIVTMNDSRDVLEDHYIEVIGDMIISISDTAPSGVQVYDMAGLIFPGLIDSHNHPVYNVLSEIPFPCTFTERYQWQGHAVYQDFKDQYYGIRDYQGDYAQATNLWKLAETRALCAGTTMIQGYNCNGSDNNDIGHQGMIINNAERFPSRIYSSTFPLNYQTDWVNNKANEFWERFVIHLSEGYSAAALQEFYTWQSWGMLDWRTSIIHGVPYGDDEWTLMASAQAHLIWSPFSNYILYATTADVPGALDAGVNVALAPDWTESGQDNLLAEMKYANSINYEFWEGVITPQQLTEMVTRNAALAIGQERRVGMIAEGYQADLMAISGDPADPYQSLLEADPADVKITVVSGRPMYGDPDIMTSFPFLGTLEDITISGVPKKLGIQIDSHGIPDSDMPIVDVMSELGEAFDASYPKLCEFISYDPGGSGAPPTATPGPPTPTPTPPANTPTPTPTPPSCDTTGVTLSMPSYDLGPGDPCSLTAYLCNASVYTYMDVPLFIILDVYGQYFFGPTFTEFDHYTIDELEPGTSSETILPMFNWPDNAGTADGIRFYGGMTNAQMSQLLGDFSMITFGWHE